MSFILDIISDEFCGEYIIAGDPTLEHLRTTALEQAYGEADCRCTYLSDCLEFISRHSDFKPDAREVFEHMDPKDHGNWRQTLTVAATLTVEAYLADQTTRDLEKLQSAIDEAIAKGFEPVAIKASCTHGWEPHQAETSWSSGVLLRWCDLDGDVHADTLRVAISGGDEIWLEVVRVAKETAIEGTAGVASQG